MSRCDSGSCAIPTPTRPSVWAKTVYLVDGPPEIDPGDPAPAPAPAPAPDPAPAPAEDWSWGRSLVAVALAVGAVGLGIAAAAATAAAAPLLAVAAVALAVALVLVVVTTSAPLVSAGRALSAIGEAAAAIADGDLTKAGRILASVALVDWLWLGVLVALAVVGLVMFSRRKRGRK